MMNDDDDRFQHQHNVDHHATVNPMIPATVGALIAEENLINNTASSILPSFVEMIMMQEFRVSSYKGLQNIMEMLVQKLRHIEESTEDHDDNNTTSNNSNRRFLVAKLLRTFLNYTRLSRILQTFPNELRFLVVYYIQRTCLLKQQMNAMLEEALYGCKRVKAVKNVNNSNTATLQPMSKSDAIRLAVLQTLGLYYLQENRDGASGGASGGGIMIQTLLQNLSGKFLSTPQQQERLRYILQHYLIPLSRLSIQSAAWLQQWRYLMGRSVYFDLPSLLLNLVVRRVTQQDQQESQQGKNANIINNGDDSTSTSNSNSTSTTNNTTIQHALRHFQNAKLQKAAVCLLSLTMALSWMARIRAIRQQMQHSNENPQEGESNAGSTTNTFPGSTTKKMIPPPPPSTSVPSKMRNLSPQVCPLCQELRVNPTTTTVSGGLVFCYKCILTEVQANGKCPVSGKACTKSDLIRLYEPHTS